MFSNSRFSEQFLSVCFQRFVGGTSISIWNTLHLTTAVEYKKRTGSFNEDLLHHMSPLGWEHINLLGEYHFNSEKVVSLDSLRPLKLS
ncbi:transposase [Priestia flexa]|uniref:transposase n=1 Tax=Priestia flexa TaxID=86664 RepID=UPI001CD41E7C|nr:transposase [Priestia flexa]MCA1204175.1 transposase [Priestia flexa]MCG7314830.1 transposase [Priestia flexa]MED4591099.1 Tn3 family transposase [Priestia flexa]WHX79790.1 Tn3 family transposase [Priestia flexa]